MLCMKCHRCKTQGRLRYCEVCVSANTRRQRKQRLTPRELIRGTKWYYDRMPELVGIVDCIVTGGYVHLEIPNEHGQFFWISTIEEFMKVWTKIEPQSDLDRTVVEHAEETKRVPLNGQISFLK
jgi:hypothetical protein